MLRSVIEDIAWLRVVALAGGGGVRAGARTASPASR